MPLSKRVQATLEEFYESPECRVIVPYASANGIPLREGVKIVADFTAKTGREAGFRYDPQGQEVVSPIVSGTDCSVKIMEGIQDISADLHTHPIDEHTASVFKQYHQTPCYFSPQDMRHAEGEGEYMSEQALVCPATNEIVFQDSLGPYFGRSLLLKRTLRNFFASGTRLENLSKSERLGSPRLLKGHFDALMAIVRLLHERRAPLDVFLRGEVQP